MPEEQKPTLAAQYDLEASEPEEAVSPGAAVEPAAPSTPSPAATVPERGPDGRFLPKEETGSAASSSVSPPTHSTRLINQALDLGISDDEIRDTPTDVLDERVYQLTKQVLAEAKANRHQATLQGDKQWDANKPITPEVTPAVPDDLDLSEEEFDPRIVKLARIAKALQKRLDEVEKDHAETKAERQEAKRLTIAERIDKAFVKFAPTLGQGRGIDLHPDSRDYRRRMAVLREVDADKSNRTLEQKIERAHDLLYGEAKPAQASAEPSDREKEWLESGLARPTHRDATELPAGPKKAERAVANLQREMGKKGENGQIDDSDFLE